MEAQAEPSPSATAVAQNDTNTSNDSQMLTYDLILDFGNVSKIRRHGGNYVQGQLFAVFDCNVHRPAAVYVCYNKKGRPYEQRKYVKVHDPAKCKCLAAGNFEYVVQQPWPQLTPAPSASVASKEQVSVYRRDLFSNPRTGMAQPNANIFNSIYFARPDGTFRNALGDAIVSDERSTNTLRAKCFRMRDFLGIGKRSVAEREPLEFPILLTTMLDWPAQVVS